MTINQTRLRDLCQRAATGDETARGEFNQHVPPLVEVVVRRWLHQQRGGFTPEAECAAASTSRARQIADNLCARMIAESRDDTDPRMRAGDTLLIDRCGGDTHWVTECESASRG